MKKPQEKNVKFWGDFCLVWVISMIVVLFGAYITISAIGFLHILYKIIVLKIS